MTELRQALLSKYQFDHEIVESVMEEMICLVNEGESPEQVLFDEGLEPDYFFDLIDEAEKKK